MATNKSKKAKISGFPSGTPGADAKPKHVSVHSAALSTKAKGAGMLSDFRIPRIKNKDNHDALQHYIDKSFAAETDAKITDAASVTSGGAARPKIVSIHSAAPSSKAKGADKSFAVDNDAKLSDCASVPSGGGARPKIVSKYTTAPSTDVQPTARGSRIPLIKRKDNSALLPFYYDALQRPAGDYFSIEHLDKVHFELEKLLIETVSRRHVLKSAYESLDKSDRLYEQRRDGSSSRFASTSGAIRKRLEYQPVPSTLKRTENAKSLDKRDRPNEQRRSSSSPITGTSGAIRKRGEAQPAPSTLKQPENAKSLGKDDRPNAQHPDSSSSSIASTSGAIRKRLEYQPATSTLKRPVNARSLDKDDRRNEQHRDGSSSPVARTSGTIRKRLEYQPAPSILKRPDNAKKLDKGDRYNEQRRDGSSSPIVNTSGATLKRGEAQPAPSTLKHRENAKSLDKRDRYNEQCHDSSSSPIVNTSGAIRKRLEYQPATATLKRPENARNLDKDDRRNEQRRDGSSSPIAGTLGATRKRSEAQPASSTLKRPENARVLDKDDRRNEQHSDGSSGPVASTTGSVRKRGEAQPAPSTLKHPGNATSLDKRGCHNQQRRDGSSSPIASTSGAIRKRLEASPTTLTLKGPDNAKSLDKGDCHNKHRRTNTGRGGSSSSMASTSSAIRKRREAQAASSTRKHPEKAEYNPYSPNVFESRIVLNEFKLPGNDPPDEFWQSVNPYCEPLTSGDLDLLDDLLKQYSEPLVPPIPELGSHYASGSAEKEEDLQQAFSDATLTSNSSKPQNSANPGKRTKAEFTMDGCVTGPLTQRLLTALFEEQPVDNLSELTAAAEDNIDENAPSSAQMNFRGLRNCFHIEERVKNELIEQGILDANDFPNKDEDEVHEEIKRLVPELSAVAEFNLSALKRLHEFAIEDLMTLDIKRELDIVEQKIIEAHTRSMQNKAKGKPMSAEEQQEIFRLTAEQNKLLRQLDETDLPLHE